MKKYLKIIGMVLFCSALLAIDTAFAAKNPHHKVLKANEPAPNTSLVCADDLLYFAQTLIGTRYRPASSSPVHGFDCSGFVSYVFKNFNFSVPRSRVNSLALAKR